MTAYSVITTTEDDSESPLSASLARKWTSNMIAAFEGDTTAVAAGVQIQTPAIADGAVTSIKMGSNVANTNIDFANYSGMIPYVQTFSSVDATSTSYTDVPNKSFLIYVPANATTLRYALFMQGVASTTTSYGRLRIPAANGSVLSVPSTYAWVSGGTLDVSSVNDTTVEVFIQHRSDGTLSNAKIQGVSAYLT